MAFSPSQTEKSDGRIVPNQHHGQFWGEYADFERENS